MASLRTVDRRQLSDAIDIVSVNHGPSIGSYPASSVMKGSQGALCGTGENYVEPSGIEEILYATCLAKDNPLLAATGWEQRR
jgi:hypothetical protein